MNKAAALEDADGLTLESILAEYKGSAYIEGAKRTPREKLDQETQRILREEKGETEPEPELQAAPTGAEAAEEFPAAAQKVPEQEKRLPEARRQKHRQRPARGELQLHDAYEIQRGFHSGEETESSQPVKRRGGAHIQAFSDMSETEQEFFGFGKYARADAAEARKEEAEQVVRKETERRRREKLLQRRPTLARERQTEKEPEPEPPEATLRQAGAAYARSVRPLKRRALLASVFTLLLVYCSAALPGKLWLPQALRTDVRLFALTTLILLLLVLYICRDLFCRGLADLLHGRLGAESMVSVSCLASVADALYIAVSGAEVLGAPFCAVSAASISCAVFGTHFSYAGYRRTYKTAIASAEPYVVRPELDRVKDGAVLLKSQTSAAGFVSRGEEEDGAAHAYALAAPLLLLCCLIFSVFAAIHGGMDAFLHNMAAMLGVSASFSALLCFGLPFSTVSRLLSRAGAALAGWSGACDIRDAVGVVITDRDIFPAGTMTMNGVRVFAGLSLNKVLSYAGSVVIASGSGLAPLFAELLRQQGSSTLQVSGFTCYEGGGIGAEIRGEKVLVGSSGFMHLMGISVPKNLGMKNAVYAAISKELVGVFSVDYTPVNSVQNALVTILNTKVLPLLAVRDFNMTPMMIQQKYKITTDKLDYLTAEARYQLSDASEIGPVRPVALLCREGLGPLAETIAAGRRLRKTVRLNTCISLLGTALGLLLTFYLCWNRAFDSLTAFHLFLYLLAWLVPVLLLSGSVKHY